MEISRTQYNYLVNWFPCFMRTVWPTLKREWSLSGVRISGPESELTEIVRMLSV